MTSVWLCGSQDGKARVHLSELDLLDGMLMALPHPFTIHQGSWLRKPRWEREGLRVTAAGSPLPVRLLSFRPPRWPSLLSCLLLALRGQSSVCPVPALG